ncbi:gametogenetin-binding protein 2-like [Corticium candelabrum]|uniref:gametogenetin-binding protein 2-like n=1 Tax=Corticium candelabrum TaxID=121492 RepID=UPI002E25D0CA|nr:gametogenetin-binding protein 2-like [Corticium candelabrum]
MVDACISEERIGDDVYRRQMPLYVEDNLTLMVEIPKTVIPTGRVRKAEIHRFCKCKYESLTADDLRTVVRVPEESVFDFLAGTVSCVGCRKSMEQLYGHLKESGLPALEPIRVTQSGELSLHQSYLSDPRKFYALFYLQRNCLNEMVENSHKCKRNKRCSYHSLDSHKLKLPICWLDVWDLLSQDCREEVCLIDSDDLLATVQSYLLKHRFCSQCKTKVLRAYSVLTDGLHTMADKGCNASLYKDLRVCPEAHHIHVACNTGYISQLLDIADTTVQSASVMRHAKTMCVAQEEVLNCIGIHLWQRLNRVWQKLKTEEQTWHMLFFASIEVIKNRFEVAVEAKRGVSSLELLVNEFKEEEDAKERRREHKRLKKKQKRAIKSRPSLPTSCRVSAVHGQLDVGMPNDSELLEENSVLFVNGICSRSEDCVCCHGLGDDDSSSESCGPRENGPSQDIAHLVGGEARERDDVIGGCLTDQYCDSTACVHGIDVVQLSGKCASECRCLDDDLIQEEDENVYFIPQEDINAFIANKQELETLRKEFRAKLKKNFLLFLRK